MSKRIIAMLLAIVLAMNLMVGCGSKEEEDFVTQGELLTMICDKFGMESYIQEEPYFASVSADNPYFPAVQACVEWDIVSRDAADYDTAAPVTRGDLALAVVNAAALTSPEVSDEEKLAIAVARDLVKHKRKKIKTTEKIYREEAEEAILKAWELWKDKTFDDVREDIEFNEEVKNYATGENAISNYQVVGNQIMIPEEYGAKIRPGEAFALAPQYEGENVLLAKADTVEKKDGYVVVTRSSEELEFDEYVENLYEHETITPNMLEDAEIYGPDGQLLYAGSATEAARAKQASAQPGDNGIRFLSAEQGVDAMPLGSLDLKVTLPNGIEGSVKVTENSVGCNVALPLNEHIQVTGGAGLKDISLTQEVNRNGWKINSALVKANYKYEQKVGIKAKTSGKMGYVPYDNRNGGLAANLRQSAFAKLNENRKGATSIKVCSIRLAGTKVANVRLNLQLKFSAEGSAELVVTTSNTAGVEYRNGNVRFIKEQHNNDVDFDCKAKVEAMASVGIELRVINWNVLSFAVDMGVGASVKSIVHVVDNEGHLIEKLEVDIPRDFDAELASVTLEASPDIIRQAAEEQGVKYVLEAESNKVKLKLDVCWDINVYPILRIGMEDTCKVAQLTKKNALKIEVLGEKSPEKLRWKMHLEDGKKVDKCTRKYKPFEGTKKKEDAASSTVSWARLGISDYVLNLEVGKQQQIGVTSLPAGAEQKDLVWSVEDPAVASVDQNGVVTAVAGGNTNVIVSVKGDASASVKCAVFVAQDYSVSGEFLPASPTAYQGGRKNAIAL